MNSSSTSITPEIITITVREKIITRRKVETLLLLAVVLFLAYWRLMPAAADMNEELAGSPLACQTGHLTLDRDIALSPTNGDIQVQAVTVSGLTSDCVDQVTVAGGVDGSKAGAVIATTTNSVTIDLSSQNLPADAPLHITPATN